MMKKQRRLLSILLTCALLCLPALQALAATSCDASVLDGTSVLFPGDSLINVAVPVMLDGAAAEMDAENPGTWTNRTEGKAFRAENAEDGTIQLTLAGYVLTVKGGTSASAADSEETGGHNDYADADPEAQVQDIAYYPSGTTVKLTASVPEGMEFTGWTADSETVTLADPAALETTLVMPEAQVTVTAGFREAQQAAPEEQPPEDGVQTDPETDVPAGSEVIDTLEMQGALEIVDVQDSQVFSDMADGQPAQEGDPGSSDEMDYQETVYGDGTAADAGMGSGGQETNPQEVSGDGTPALYDVTIYDGVSQESYTAGSYAAGDTVVISAADRTPEGYVFTSWSVDTFNAEVGDLYSSETSFVMPESQVALSAHYEAGQPAVTESETVGQPEVMESEATGQSETTGQSEVTGQSETTEQSETTAPETEAPVLYTVTVTNGVIADTGLTAGSYAPQTVLSLRADAPVQGMQFSKWSAFITDTGAVVDDTVFTAVNSADTQLTVPSANLTVRAEYVPATYKVTVANGLVNGTSPEMTVQGGTEVTVTANANPAGQVFSRWEVNGGAYSLGDAVYSPTVTVVVDQNLSFVPVYEGVQYTIEVNDGKADYEETVSGTVVTIKAKKAPEGMEFDYWQVNSGNVSLADAYSRKTTFTMPAADVEVSAYYKVKEYYVTVSNGTSDLDVCNMGQMVTVSSDYPVNGKEFDQWRSVDGNVSFADASRWKTTFVMPASDVTVQAVYKDGPSADNNQILDLVAGGEYVTNSTIRFTASGAGMNNSNPNPGDYRYRPTGYQIGNVTGSWQSSPYTTSMAIKATGEYTLRVTFARDVFNGSNWAPDGTTDTKSVTFRVVTPAAAVATGDDTPILIMSVITGASCLLFLLLLVTFIRRRRNS